MTILSLRDNRIVRIPDDIGRMPNLQVINLACNRYVSIPADSGPMLKLLHGFQTKICLQHCEGSINPSRKHQKSIIIIIIIILLLLLFYYYYYVFYIISQLSTHFLLLFE